MLTILSVSQVELRKLRANLRLNRNNQVAAFAGSRCRTCNINNVDTYGGSVTEEKWEINANGNELLKQQKLLANENLMKLSKKSND